MGNTAITHAALAAHRVAVAHDGMHGDQRGEHVAGRADDLALHGLGHQGSAAQHPELHQADLATISNTAAAQARQALEKQQQAERSLRDLDTRMTKEKTDALTENDRLRRAVADGARRLRIAGTCRAPDVSSDLLGAASTASLGDAGTIELAPTAGRSVLDIRAGIIADQSALRALQTYVKRVCR